MSSKETPTCIVMHHGLNQLLLRPLSATILSRDIVLGAQQAQISNSHTPKSWCIRRGHGRPYKNNKTQSEPNEYADADANAHMRPAFNKMP